MKLASVYVIQSEIYWVPTV